MPVPQPFIPGQMPQVDVPIHSNPSTVYADPRHHTAPDQGSVAGLSQDLTPALPRQRSFVKDRTPLLQSLPNVQQPNTSSSKPSQALTKDSSSSASNPWKVRIPTPTNSGTDQIPSSSLAHQETQSSIQARKSLSESTSTTATSSIPTDISKSSMGRASDWSNPTSMPSSSLSLLSAQKSSSQIPADPSSTSNPLKQAEGSVPAKPASSGTIIHNGPGQGPVSKTYDIVERYSTCINLYRITLRVA